ncbi:hypothetical protein ACHAWF_004313 [Thalassiosira exigua]
MTVTWHVNGLKVTHKDPFEITKFADYLAYSYCEKLVVHRGPPYLSVMKYIKKIEEDFPEMIKGPAETPAADLASLKMSVH